MNFYVRDWGRPCGVEPKIFSSYKEAEVVSTEDSPLQFECEVIGFETELQARSYIKKQNPEGYKEYFK